MATLRDLNACFLRWRQETTAERDAAGMYVFRDAAGEPELWSPGPTRDIFEQVGTLAEAHGIRFLCPQSFAKNGGPMGAHSVLVWFEGSPVPGHIGRNKDGQTVRWKVVGGSGLGDLQLSPSILEQDDGAPDEWRCGWHGFVGSSGVPPGEAR